MCLALQEIVWPSERVDCPLRCGEGVAEDRCCRWETGGPRHGEVWLFSNLSSFASCLAKEHSSLSRMTLNRRSSETISFHLSGMPIGRQKKSSTYFCIIPYQNEKSYNNFTLHFEAWVHTMINKLVLSQSSSNSICWPQSQFFSVFDLIPITS